MATATMLPVSDGYATGIAGQFPSSPASHWDKVVNASATQYVFDVGAISPVSEVDYYNLGTPVIPRGSMIDSLSLTAYTLSQGGGANYVSFGLRLGTTDVMSAQFLVPTGAYGGWSATIARPGGGSWTIADLAALQAILQFDCAAGKDIRCDLLNITVNYTLSPLAGIRAAIQTALSSGSGPAIRTFNRVPKGVNEFPACLIFPKAGGPNTMPRQTQQIAMEVTLLVGAWGDVDLAQDIADSYIQPTGTNSIQYAVDHATYGSYASHSRFQGWRDYGHISFGELGQYFGVRFDFIVE